MDQADYFAIAQMDFLERKIMCDLLQNWVILYIHLLKAHTLLYYYCLMEKQVVDAVVMLSNLTSKFELLNQLMPFSCRLKFIW